MHPPLRLSRDLILPLSLVLLVAGCAGGPRYRLHPETRAKIGGIRTLAVPAPQVKMHDVSTGGVVEQRGDWSEQAGEAIREAIVRRFAERSPAVVPTSATQESKAELLELFELFGVVGGAVVMHTYTPGTIFPEKVRRFEYSLGPLEKALDPPPADGAILVQGAGSVTTGGRVALAVVGAFLGMAVPTGGMVLQAGLADSDGTLLWYNYVSSSFSTDLRNPGTAAEVVGRLFEGFPEVGP